MLAAILASALAVGADITPEQLALLKTFRAEFVELTPGEGDFPSTYSLGRDNGPEQERPATKIAMERPFSVARYEVPQNLWEAVMGNNPSKWKGERNSVEMLTWDDAVDFCKRVTALLQQAELIGKDEEVRLPSEVEWEYFARAGTTTLYSFGDDVARLGDYAWHTGNAAGNDPPVGAKKPNAWGLYDVHGYLWEWCSDDWADDHSGAAQQADPTLPRKGADDAMKVLRSGSWKDSGEMLTSSYRRRADRQTADDAVGLRCALAKKR